ncbi:hypothetical protein JTB14_035363 [Gonioctena quinquepunctata]|nr:hypothetical protein JTB14_035363 [Gonioctena quinquepunctata]
MLSEEKECATTGRSYTFGEVRTRSRNFGKALRAHLKLKKGDVVAVFSANIPEFSTIILGVLDAGLVLTTLNPLYTQEKVSYLFYKTRYRRICTPLLST